MKWTQIAADQPALGRVVHDRMIKPRVVLLGTTRRDGSARISGVKPLVMDGELWLSMMSTSTKGPHPGPPEPVRRLLSVR